MVATIAGSGKAGKPVDGVAASPRR